MRLNVLIGLVLFLLSGCSDPKCPSNLVQVGMVCKRCPDGTERLGNTCVPVDGGKAIDAVDIGGDDDDEATADSAADVDVGQNAREDAGTSAGASSTDAESSKDGSTASDSPCFLDRDKDGVGAGMPVDCDTASLVTSLGFSLSDQNNDCDDNNAQRSPRLSDLCGDNVDNDCDNKPDDEANNACGGPCTAQLAHQPGEACTNELEGACRHSGTYECDGSSVRCNAPAISAGREMCGDQIDNDCDGAVDEIDAIDAIAWYRDCDGDGYAPTASGAVPSCAKPAPRENCSWTSKVPQPTSHSDWDCNDTNSSYRPAQATASHPADSLTSISIVMGSARWTQASCRLRALVYQPSWTI